MQLQESGEMYLETILVLSKQLPVVRAIDISEYMNYSKPSVSRALGILKENNYVIVDKNGYITLTESGSEIANKIYERHVVFSKFLMSIGVDEKTATDDACRIEHVISDESFAALKEYIKNNNL